MVKNLRETRNTDASIDGFFALNAKCNPATPHIEPGRYPQTILKIDRPVFDQQLFNCSGWMRGLSLGVAS